MMPNLDEVFLVFHPEVLELLRSARQHFLTLVDFAGKSVPCVVERALDLMKTASELLDLNK